jgi:Polyketide cyclase / dehydrase and lipid transport
VSSTMRVSLVCVACLSVADAHARAGSEPTQQEWRRVLAGEHVVRPQKQRMADLHLIGGVAWQRIEAPAEVVWDTVTRPELYRSLLPYAIDAQPLDERDVLIRHRVIFGEVSYRLRFAPDHEARVLRFRVPEAWGALRAGWGELRVKPLNERACVVSWSVMADPELGFVGRLFDGVVQKTMLAVPVSIRKFMAKQQAAGVSP